MSRILLVDDDERLRRVLTLRLEADGHVVTAAESGDVALAVLDQALPDLVLTDLKMPNLDGMALLERLQALQPALPVIMLTAHGDIPDAVTATKAGAVEFLTKPVEKETLAACIEKHGRSLDAEADWAKGFVGRGPKVRRLLDDAHRAARSTASILICGPSGSGKEVLARAIHQASARAKKPFVALNCGAVPADLLESELFGHRKGAFTGALSDAPGLFRSADGGSIFLDEIGDMPAALQVKLLRVLQEREVRPIGETRSTPVDVRVLSATHRDLDVMVGRGEFREDLLYRLKVVTLSLPPLNERREDIPQLVAHQLAALVKSGSPRRVFAPEAMEVLAAADWPGNVRQLFNVVEQTVALAPGRVISASQVKNALGESPRGLPSFDEARAEFTRNYLRQLLELADGNVSQAARLAERNRTDFYKLLKRYGMDPQNFKDTGE